MRTLDIPGGWYGAAWPDGAYAVCVPSSRTVTTHHGTLDTPVGFPIHLDVTMVGGWHIAGKSWEGHHTVLYRDGAWTRIEQEAIGGQCSVAFAPDGTLVINGSTIPYAGANGIRYVTEDGEIVSGDETYGSPTLRLGEYTIAGDLAIGQSGYDVVAAVLDSHGQPTGERRVLVRGQGPHGSTDIKVKRVGDSYAMAVHQFANGRTHLLWFDRAELSLFPREAEPDPVPDHEPTPTPDPEEPPVPDPVAVPNLSGISNAQWAAHDMPTRQLAAYRAGLKPAILQLQAHYFARLTPIVQSALPVGWRAMWERYRNNVPGTSWNWLPDQFLLIDPNGFVHSVKVIQGASEAEHRRHDVWELDEQGERRYKWVLGDPAWNHLTVIGHVDGRLEHVTVDEPLMEPLPESALGPSPFTGGDGPDPGDEDDVVPNPGTNVPNVGTCDCAAELAELRAQLAVQEQVMVDAAKAANDRLTKLENAKPPAEDIDALTAAIVERINMGRAWGHTHGLGVKK